MYGKKKTGTADSMERKAKAKVKARAGALAATESIYKAKKKMEDKAAKALEAQAKSDFLKERSSLKKKK